MNSNPPGSPPDEDRVASAVRAALSATGGLPRPVHQRHADARPQPAPLSTLEVYSGTDFWDWQTRIQSVLDEENGRLRRMLDRLPAAPLIKPLAPPPSDALLDLLLLRYPNFAAVVDFIRDSAELCRLCDAGMRVPPLLLVGEPGVGKTAFPRALAQALTLPLRMIGMAHATAGFALGGMDPGWANAQPGWPFREMVWGSHANPIILLDEIDKATTGDCAPLGPLYSLLEPSTASRFTDDLVTLPIDCSAIIWVASANDASAIPAPLVSRFEVFTVTAPRHDQIPAVIGNVWRELIENESWWGCLFEADLPPATVNAMQASGNPREATRRLRRAAARAARSGRTFVLPEDLAVAPSRPESAARSRIGFV